MFENIDIKQINLDKNDLLRFEYKLNQEGCHTHSILMLKNDKIFFEKYFEPFDQNSLFRMYSQTKSLVSLSILFLVDENKLSLNDTLSSYFSEYIDSDTDYFLLKQTIKESLMMETSVRCNNWFKDPENDRVKLYFKSKAIRPAGLVWEYDSAVSQVLEALVEKITGLNALEFLKLKVFNEIGTFTNAYMLKTPDGRFWGDSGLIATTRDMASFACFILNKGFINGKQYINSNLLEEAISNLTCNNESGYLNYRSVGYGYQFFKTKYNGFMLAGLGNQLTIVFPKYNLIFVFTSNDQGSKEHRETLLNLVYDIVDRIISNNYSSNRFDINENIDLSSIKTKINNIIYKSVDDFVFSEFKIDFDNNMLYLNYINNFISIPFGIENYVISKLPIEGYSNLVGKEKTKNFYYNIQTKAIFTSNKKIIFDIEVIDIYGGTLFINCSFKEEYSWVKLNKYTENFLNDFIGESLFITK